VKLAYHFIYVLIITALVLLLVNTCNKKAVPCPEIVETIPFLQKDYKEINPATDTSLHSAPVGKVIRKVKPIKIIPVELPDTGGYSLPWKDDIIKNHYSKKYYRQEYKDSAMSIIVTDTVSENEITYRKIDYLRLLPDRNFNVVTAKKRNIIFVGAQVGSSIDKFTDIGPNIAWMNKKERIIFIHYNVLDAQKSNLTIGGYWPVRLRRR
jgi:hypothetical protein